MQVQYYFIKFKDTEQYEFVCGWILFSVPQPHSNDGRIYVYEEWP